MKKSCDKYKEFLAIKLNKICVVGIITMISVGIIFNIYYNLSKPSNLSSILDYIVKPGTNNGAANVLAFTFVILPFFNFLIIKLSESHEKILVLHRYNNKREIWNIQVRNMIIISIVVMVIVVFINYIGSAIKIGSFNNNWPKIESSIFKVAKDFKVNLSGRNMLYSTGGFLFLVFISGTLGLIAEGLLILTLKSKVKHSFSVYILIIAIMFVEFQIIGGIFLLKRMLMGPMKMLYIGEIFGDIIFLVSISIVIYFIGRKLNDKKEFYNL